MPKFVKRRSQKTGLPPGTLMHIGEVSAGAVGIEAFFYNESGYDERSFDSFEECSQAITPDKVVWINIIGLNRPDIIEAAGARFGLHPLLLEDVLNTEQRPKLEEYENCLFVALKMLRYIGEELDIEHVSLVQGGTFVISFQEHPGDVFDSIRDRIRTGKGRIRKLGADFLAYALIDTVVDNYFSIMEHIGDDIEILDSAIIDGTDGNSPYTLRRLNALKRELIYLRKSIWPIREVANGFEKVESNLITQAILPYYRDVYDHTIQVIDSLETFRDILNSMHDTYLSTISNRMNEVMKVLTMISTLFMPLSFLAGLYGMNFHFMPELEWKWGYYALLVVMGAIGGSMITFFRSKKWL
jgi:magnesium transporter